MKKLATTAVVLTGALVLVGCSDDSGASDASSADDPTSASPTAEETPQEPEDTDFGRPAAGPTIKGKGYSYKVPKGWKEITKRARKVQPSVDTAAADTKQDGYAENVNVGLNSAPGATLEQLSTSLSKQLKPLVPKLQVRDDVVIDGQEAAHVRGRTAGQKSDYFLEQFGTVDDAGKVTLVTFSFAPDMKPAKRDRIVNSVLASMDFDAPSSP